MDLTEANQRLDRLLQKALRDERAETDFLRELSGQQVVTILLQPPGPGAVAPQCNLAQWQRKGNDLPFVPVFISEADRLYALPPPATFTKVPMRVLLAAGGEQTYIINPLSQTPFELQESQRAQLRRYIAETHHDAEWPSLRAPWRFQLPDDALYPVAVKLVEWFNTTGRVNQAFLYELTRGAKPRTEIVLAINEAADTLLADTLSVIATRAGADAASFLVRFLPDEPSHREGLAKAGITPFYQRPAPLHH